MNPLTSFIERIAIGQEPDPADLPVLKFNSKQSLTRRNLTESVLVIADVGTGKTTLLRTISRAMLRDRFGGLVLCVKLSQIEEFRSACAAEGRENDLIILTPGRGHAFNPLVGETNSAEAAALLVELAEVLAARTREGGDNDAFWRAQLGIIMRNLFALCRIAYGKYDLLLAAELFDGRANNLAELADPSWQQRSPLAAALNLARERAGDREARLAVEYFTHAFPAHGDRLQGSLAATVCNVFDHLRRSPLRDLFTGESSFALDDLFDHGKVCVVGLPALDSADGRIANALMQFCFCRAATRRPRRNYSFLLSDECQETVSRELMRKLAVLREFKVASVLLTQNIAVLDDKLGESAREGLCGLLGLKLFGPQGHAATREWAAEQIGKRKILIETKSTGRTTGERSRGTSTGTSVHEQWDHRVPPSRFAQLQVGETIGLRRGRVWHSRWHKDHPGKGGSVAIVDS